MTSFQTAVTPSRRAGNRFISAVRRALQKAFAEEASKRGLTQAELARRLGVNRSVVTRELRGVENLTLRSVAELAFGMGRRAELTLAEPVIKVGDNGGNVSDGVAPVVVTPAGLSFAKASSAKRLVDGTATAAAGVSVKSKIVVSSQ